MSEFISKSSKCSLLRFSGLDKGMYIYIFLECVCNFRSISIAVLLWNACHILVLENQ